MGACSLSRSSILSRMRVIDRKWTELAAGYQAVCSLQTRLESEFKRAVEIGYKQQYNRDVTAWRKRRRIFIALAITAPLSIAALCLSARYFRETACVSIYWAVLVLIILGTLGVAGRTYIRETVNRPALGGPSADLLNLERRWWADLAPEELASPSGKDKRKPNFLTLLAGLPDTFLARRGPPVEGEASLYVFAPSGPWIFTLREWSGDIIRQEGVWKDIPRKGEPIMYSQPPDAQWVRLRDGLADLLNERHPELAGKIHGGAVFVDPQARLFKEQIQGNTSAYGPAAAWAKRLSETPPMDGLPLQMQLETLDALMARELFPGEVLDLTYSAKRLAERKYQETVVELRGFVAKMMGEQVDRASASR